MKKQWAPIISLAILLVTMLLVGCSPNIQNIRKDIIAFAKEDSANVKALKQVSEELKVTWPFYSGCLDAIPDRLSGRIIKQQEELDALYASDEEWNDRATGKALILRSLLVIELTAEGMENLLPNFLRLLAPLL